MEPKIDNKKTIEVYKFSPLESALPNQISQRNGWTFDIIRNRQVFMPSFSTLNDVHEGVPYCEPENDPIYSYITKQMRIVSFSLRCKSPLLWAHYANGYRGICIRARVRVDGPNSEYMHSAIVDYIPAGGDQNIRKITKSETVNAQAIYWFSQEKMIHGYAKRLSNHDQCIADYFKVMTKIAFYKSNEWAYEEEIRFCSLPYTKVVSVDGKAFLDLDQIISIYAGPNICLANLIALCREIITFGEKHGQCPVLYIGIRERKNFEIRFAEISPEAIIGFRLPKDSANWSFLDVINTNDSIKSLFGSDAPPARSPAAVRRNAEAVLWGLNDLYRALKKSKN